MFKMSSAITHKADRMSTKPLSLAEEIGKQKLVMYVGYQLHFARYQKNEMALSYNCLICKQK